jgi:hypothetical protein
MVNYKADFNLDGVIDFIARTVPSFRSSPEFVALEGSARESPGMMCGTLGEFLVRLQREELDGGLDEAGRTELSQAYAALEGLAGSPDPDVNTLTVTEVFDSLHADAGLLSKLKQRFGPGTTALYERWME